MLLKPVGIGEFWQKIIFFGGKSVAKLASRNRNAFVRENPLRAVLFIRPGRFVTFLDLIFSRS